MVMKLKNTNCDKNQKHKLWKKKTQKLKMSQNWNFEKT